MWTFGVKSCVADNTDNEFIAKVKGDKHGQCANAAGSWPVFRNPIDEHRSTRSAPETEA